MQIRITGSNIISSLGFTAEENFLAVRQGVSGIKRCEAGVFGLPEPFMASLIDKERLRDEFARIAQGKDYTDLEKATILSVFLANKEAQIDLSDKRTIFILSTTKGNVDLLAPAHSPKSGASSFPQARLERAYLWKTAELLADFFKNPNTPIVVSNACISGAAAQIAAMRVLQSGNYDYAVAAGVDFLSKFIISGFQSFKALSAERCRPFDQNRCGLNLGEAAAAIVFAKAVKGVKESEGVRLIAGAIRNDANHISAPSRTGEGSFNALKSMLSDLKPSRLKSQIAFVNAHGTATSYNDAMEMNAIVRAGLENVPVNSLKSYFGHTLGAAGIVETVISAQALNNKLILKTLGYEQHEQLTIDNTPFTLNICKENRTTDKTCFVKMMSGFGGVNAGLLFAANGAN